MAIAGTGGVAHPPGYPLFSLLVRLAALLPFGAVAWRASLAAALQAAAALGVLHRCVALLTGSRVGALVAAASLGLSLHYWRYATVSEVFAGACLTSVLVLAAALATARAAPGPREAAWTGLAFATGIAHHHTVVFLAPLGLFSAWRLLRGGRPVTSLLAGLLGLAPGFLLYLALRVPGGAWRWGDTGTWAGLLHHLLRRDYGTTRLAISSVEVAFWEHPLHWLLQTPQELCGLYAGLAVLGVALAWRRGPSRPVLHALLAALACTGPVFLGLLNLRAAGPDLVVTARFHLVPTTLLSVFTGIGAAWLCAALPHARTLRPLLVAGLAVPLALNLPRAPHRGWTVLEDHLLNLLSDLPAGALVLTAGDPPMFGARYLQAVAGVRPDVAVVNPPMLGYPWYRAALRGAHPGLVLEAHGRALEVPGIVAANTADRAVFVSFGLYREYADALPEAAPWGAVALRILPPGVPLPHPSEVEPVMRAAFAGYTLRSRPESRWEITGTWEAPWWEPYALAFDGLANAWRQAGDPAAEARCRATAEDLAPWLSGAP